MILTFKIILKERKWIEARERKKKKNGKKGVMKANIPVYYYSSRLQH